MADDLRGMRHLRTLSRLMAGRRTRTPVGALLELARLQMERQCLLQELHRIQRRSDEIGRHLAEIDDTGVLLQGMVDRQGAAAPGPQAPAGGAAAPAPAVAPPALHTRRWTY